PASMAFGRRPDRLALAAAPVVLASLLALPPVRSPLAGGAARLANLDPAAVAGGAIALLLAPAAAPAPWRGARPPARPARAAPRVRPDRLGPTGRRMLRSRVVRKQRPARKRGRRAPDRALREGDGRAGALAVRRRLRGDQCRSRRRFLGAARRRRRRRAPPGA